MPYDGKQQRKDFLQGLASLSHMGFSMAFCVLLGVLAGKYLDNFFDTSPWLLVVFSLIGAMASFKVLFELAKKK